MASMVITKTYLDTIRDAAAAAVAKAQYRIGTDWKDAQIEEASRQVNGSVHVSFYVRKDPTQPSEGVNALRVVNSAGVALVTKDESIPFGPGVDRLLYRFKINISVLSANQTQGEG